jgi:hypothetical protein
MQGGGRGFQKPRPNFAEKEVARRGRRVEPPGSTFKAQIPPTWLTLALKHMPPM